MNEQELTFARKIGIDVSRGKIKIPCPNCYEDDPAEQEVNPQYMSSVGDMEETLFCPHCEMEIELKVKIW